MADLIVTVLAIASVFVMLGTACMRYEIAWLVGLHPWWYSFNDADEPKRQKEATDWQTPGVLISFVRDWSLSLGANLSS